MKRVVAFDLDGTLIDSLPGIASAANALLADEGLPPIPASQVAGYVGHGERVFLQRLIADTALDGARYDDLMQVFVRHYVDVGRDTPLFPGVRAVLDDLKARDVRLALVTNKPAAPLAPVLAGTGLDGVFDIVVAGDTLPTRKPDPTPLRFAFDRLGASGVYVGDSPVDAETAQRAGVPFLLFTEGIRTVPTDAIPHNAKFSDFAEFAEAYGRLLT